MLPIIIIVLLVIGFVIFGYFAGIILIALMKVLLWMLIPVLFIFIAIWLYNTLFRPKKAESVRPKLSEKSKSLIEMCREKFTKEEDINKCVEGSS